VPYFSYPKLRQNNDRRFLFTLDPDQSASASHGAASTPVVCYSGTPPTFDTVNVAQSPRGTARQDDLSFGSESLSQRSGYLLGLGILSEVDGCFPRTLGIVLALP